jgi:hypothetical protein
VARGGSDPRCGDLEGKGGESGGMIAGGGPASPGDLAPRLSFSSLPSPIRSLPTPTHPRNHLVGCPGVLVRGWCWCWQWMTEAANRLPVFVGVSNSDRFRSKFSFSL